LTKTTKKVSRVEWKILRFVCHSQMELDKTNYEIFVNGPFDPEMHIACYCRAKKKRATADVKNKFVFSLLQLIAAEVVDIDMRARILPSLKLLIITFPKTRGLVIGLMEWN
jgi:hypothetical protein